MIELDPALDDALVQAAQARLPAALHAGKPLGAAIAAVSQRYTTDRASLARARVDSAAELAARALFFLPADLCKLHVPLAELAGAGLLPAPARVLDLGAGVGAQTIGLISWLGARAGFAVELCDRDPGALALAVPLVQAAASAVGAGVGVGARPGAAASAVTVTTRTGELEPLPAGPYDLILMGTTLNELYLDRPDPVPPRAQLLAALVERLTPQGSLIVIEPALRETARALEAVRDQVLAAGAAQVFAPCTRGGPCPALADARDFCHEDRSFRPTPRLARLAAAAERREHGLKFAYLTLRRPAATAAAPGPAQAPGPGWARVVSAPLVSKGKTEWFICGDDGRVRLRVLARERGPVQALARELDRGDLVRAPGGTPGERRPARP